MDSRTARRTAEKAARDLIADRAALIGELAVLKAEHTRRTDDTAHAAARGRQIVADARAEAARLLEAAQKLTRDSEQRYDDAYTVTTAAGWTAGDLTALGHQPAAGSPRRRASHEQPGSSPPRATTSPTTTPAATTPAPPGQSAEHTQPPGRPRPPEGAAGL